MLTETEQRLSQARPNEIDFQRVSELHYLGNYLRPLPVNLARMMENAYDWEHLPYVHSSSFSAIELIASGGWGWRAKIGLPAGASADHQLIDLLVAKDKNYWVSTVYSGPGTGIEIHTQATAVSDNGIEVDVRFYLTQAPESETAGANILQYLQQQYATLYDEDLALMSGRQHALDDRLRWEIASIVACDVRVGRAADLDPAKVHVIVTEDGRYCVRMWQDKWIAHSAVCPHLLGPLEDSLINDQGAITCPWHGYRFDLRSGTNLDEKCRALASPPQILQIDGTIYLRFEA